MQKAGKVHLERSLLPMEEVMIGLNTTFGGVDGFAAGVVSALYELYNMGHLAHLDLRLENICFDPDSHKAILINLDRSAPIDCPFVELRPWHDVIPLKKNGV